MRRALVLSAALAVLAAAAPAAAGEAPEIGTAFPAGFEVPVDVSLNTPVLGFGSAEGQVVRTPVIFLHGNNDTPYPTKCNEQYGKVRDFAQSFLAAGWSPKELWGLGYQGDQCDLQQDQRRRAGVPHTTVANVPDLRAFVRSVLAYTGASQVDIVGHQPWHHARPRVDAAGRRVRRRAAPRRSRRAEPRHPELLTVPAELLRDDRLHPGQPGVPGVRGARHTAADRAQRRRRDSGPAEYVMVVNADTSFVYIPKQDGVLAPVPAQDREGRPHDFSRSAHLDGATVVEVTGLGTHDRVLLAAHTGIVNSPRVWKLAADFLAPPAAAPQPATPVAAPPAAASAAAPAAASAASPASASQGTPARGRSAVLPATGAPTALAGLAVAVLLLAAAGCRRRG